MESDVPLGWQWPDGDVLHYLDKARRALRGHERADELARSCLVWLSVCGWAGRPLESLRGWVDTATLGKLRGLLLEFDDAHLREWVEKQVGWPPVSPMFRRVE